MGLKQQPNEPMAKNRKESHLAAKEQSSSSWPKWAQTNGRHVEGITAKTANSMLAKTKSEAMPDNQNPFESEMSEINNWHCLSLSPILRQLHWKNLLKRLKTLKIFLVKHQNKKTDTPINETQTWKKGKYLFISPSEGTSICSIKPCQLHIRTAHFCGWGWIIHFIWFYLFWKSQGASVDLK